MARIEIKLPENFNYAALIPIRIEDINRGNHVSHVATLDILAEARAQYLISRGYEDEVIIRKGIGFIISDVGIIYRSQSYYGQIIKVEMAPGDFRSRSFDLIYRISDAGNNNEIVRAKTGLLLFNYNAGKVLTLPEDLKQKLEG
jgi:acyl-CoA thioester hydrolase